MEDVEIDRNQERKLISKQKNTKVIVHPKCVESVMEEQLISFTGFELTCCYIKDVFLTVIP